MNQVTKSPVALLFGPELQDGHIWATVGPPFGSNLLIGLAPLGADNDDDEAVTEFSPINSITKTNARP